MDRIAYTHAHGEESCAAATNLAKGLLTDTDIEEAATWIGERLKTIENLCYDNDAAELFGQIIGHEDIRAQWNNLPLNRQRTIIDRLIRVVLLPAPKGRGWHPNKVQIVWREPH